jgi:sugar O-acyltransferase (sialic acid O-acetyltransferase NeuD family)
VSLSRPDERQAVLVFPYNGNAREALDCLGPRHAFIGFIDDDPVRHADGSRGHRVMGREALAAFPDAGVLAVPGNARNYRDRIRLIASLGLAPGRFPSIVHPGAFVSRDATIGSGVLIMAGVVVTSNARIGNHVCLLPNTVVHHDVIIGDYTLVGAGVGISGGVCIDDNAYIGSGARIIEGARIGRRALVGLGAVVIDSVGDDQCVVGNPARPIRRCRHDTPGGQ